LGLEEGEEEMTGGTEKTKREWRQACIEKVARYFVMKREQSIHAT